VNKQKKKKSLTNTVPKPKQSTVISILVDKYVPSIVCRNKISTKDGGKKGKNKEARSKQQAARTKAV
jgi:hypothetical protein